MYGNNPPDPCVWLVNDIHWDIVNENFILASIVEA